MSKKQSSSEQPVVKVGQDAALVVPEHMRALVGAGGEGMESLETMRHHRILNRLSVIQPLTPREKKEKLGGEGAIAIPAAELVVARPGELLTMVPLLFFDEYVQWGDRNDKTGQKIRSRTFDHASVLARKCADPEKRVEGYGEKDAKTGKHQFNARNTHHLNFLMVVYGQHPLRGTMAVASFSKGEFKKGRALMAAIQLRKIAGRQAPLWTCVFDFSVDPDNMRKNEKGEWFGMDFVNSTSPWIDPDDMEPFRALHGELLKDYKEQALSVGHEEAEAEEAATEGAAVGGGDGTVDANGEKLPF